MDLPYKRIDKYEIIKEIGRGGMAVVYLAYDTVLEREVAIKVLPEYFRHDSEFIKRFKREAISASKLKHPNIIIVFDADIQEKTPFIVMELLPGGSLENLIKENGKLPPYLTVKLSMQIADALDIAHRNGILHRDIKPSNILFGENKRPVITDFGIAKSLTGTKLTTTGQVLGTPEYMAPEIIQGTLNTSFDIRSDIYSLGIVMYEMLTGDLPFKGETPLSIAFQQVNREPTPIREKSPSVPLSLCHIVEKCLKKKPDERYQTAEELYRDLSDIVNSDEILSSKNGSEKILSAFVESNIKKLKGGEATAEIAKEEKENIKEEGIESKKKEEYKEGVVEHEIASESKTKPNKSKTFSEQETRKIEESPTVKSVLHEEEQKAEGTTQRRNSLLRKPSLLIPLIALIIAIPLAIFFAARARNSRGSIAYQTLGYVSVTSNPSGASVYINEKNTGTTPLMHYKLKPGKYTITIKKEGYRDYTLPIDVEGNKTNEISVALLPLNTTETLLSVTSSPPGAEIYIDGKDTGKQTPQTINNIEVGKHTITLKKQNYKTFSGPFTITKGNTKTINATLIPVNSNTEKNTNNNNTNTTKPKQLVATLSISSSPQGAEIYIDNKDTGKQTPQTINNIEAGKHTIELRKTGYKKYVVPISLLPGKLYNLNPTLTKSLPLLYVSSSPKGAEIYIDGEDRNYTTPCSFWIIAPGKHTITLKLKGYKDYTKIVTVTENKTTNVSATLSAIVTCSWTKMNNGLTNTYVWSLAIDPTNTQTIYAETNGGGVFKSTDGGARWTKMNNGLTNTHVFSLAIDPTNTQTIYAEIYGGGIFKYTCTFP